MRALVRIFSFAAKEITDIKRQPRLVLTLIMGPFLILLAFGLGYNSTQPPIHALLVVPENSGLPGNQQEYTRHIPPPFVIDGLYRNAEEALAKLQAGQTEVVIIFPEDTMQSIRSGHRATVQVIYRELDPIASSWIPYFTRAAIDSMNRQLVTQAISSTRLLENTSLSPQVIVAPLDAKTRNIVPYQPSVVIYYLPSAIALLLQHLAITLASFSLVRERLIGAIELFRVAPVGRTEVITGKYLGYGIVTLIVGAVLIASMMYFLGLPLLGSVYELAILLAALTFSSLGIGFFISAISKSESQAVQFSMLTLLASIFFSGFFLPIESLNEYARWISYILPVTYAIDSLKEVLLLGIHIKEENLYALGAIFLITTLASSFILGRDFKRK